MGVGPVVIVAGGCLFLAHKTGVLQRAAARLSRASAAYAATHPSTGFGVDQGQEREQTASSGSSSSAGTASDQQEPYQAQTRGPAQDSKYRLYEGAWGNTMHRDEAMLILGFDPAGPTPEPKEVGKQHRSLMSSGFHSDLGGPEIFATKINEARDCLLPKK